MLQIPGLQVPGQTQATVTLIAAPGSVTLEVTGPLRPGAPSLLQ
jgi:hypothetical protein